MLLQKSEIRASDYVSFSVKNVFPVLVWAILARSVQKNVSFQLFKGENDVWIACDEKNLPTGKGKRFLYQDIVLI